jgi:hypothetical protein
MANTARLVEPVCDSGRAHLRMRSCSKNTNILRARKRQNSAVYRPAENRISSSLQISVGLRMRCDDDVSLTTMIAI